MSSFLYVNDEESRGKVNIDELYEKKQQRELKQLTIFNKLLNNKYHFFYNSNFSMVYYTFYSKLESPSMLSVIAFISSWE